MVDVAESTMSATNTPPQVYKCDLDVRDDNAITSPQLHHRVMGGNNAPHPGSTSDTTGWTFEETDGGGGGGGGGGGDGLFDDVDAVTPWAPTPPQTWQALAAEQQQRVTETHSSSSVGTKRKRPRNGCGSGGGGKDTSGDEKKGTVESQSGTSRTGTTEEEQKRIRRVKNRASVEKCRTKQRQRLDSLTKERGALTTENGLLRTTADNVRSAMQQILEQVAELSGVNCHVQLS